MQKLIKQAQERPQESDIEAYFDTMFAQSMAWWRLADAPGRLRWGLTAIRFLDLQQAYVNGDWHCPQCGDLTGSTDLCEDCRTDTLYNTLLATIVNTTDPLDLDALEADLSDLDELRWLLQDQADFEDYRQQVKEQQWPR